MKRLLIATVALSMLGGSAAMAQPRHDDHRGPDRSGPPAKHWGRGQRMPSNYYRDRGHYVDYRHYRLRAPPRGYQWVRTDDNQFAMVALTTGLIAAIAAASN
jgi:Ni/Co efflux regulator RcnB